MPIQYIKKGLNIESALPASFFLDLTQCNGFTDRYLDNNYVYVVISFLDNIWKFLFLHAKRIYSIETMRKLTKLTQLILMQIKSN